MEISVQKLTAICFLVIGLSHILQPRLWVQFFIRLREKGEIGSFINAFIHFPLGVFIVAFHNIWHGFPGTIVTIIGWGLTIKGGLYFLFPGYGVRMLGAVSTKRAWQFIVAGVLTVAFAVWILLSHW